MNELDKRQKEKMKNKIQLVTRIAPEGQNINNPGLKPGVKKHQKSAPPNKALQMKRKRNKMGFKKEINNTNGLQTKLRTPVSGLPTNK